MVNSSNSILALLLDQPSLVQFTNSVRGMAHLMPTLQNSREIPVSGDARGPLRAHGAAPTRQLRAGDVGKKSIR